jgi:uncharacterized protein
MLLVPTRVAPSPIAGLGLFAAEPIRQGAVLWRFMEGFDQLISLETVDGLPEAFRRFLDTYAYVSHAFPGRLVLSCDHAKFMNHSEDPNTASEGLETYARRAIAAGDEITCDYRACCVGWPGFG